VVTVSLPVTIPAASTAVANAAKTERRGPVLDVLKELLADGDGEAVLAIFSKLVARNTELERRLADLLSRGRKNEGVSTAQLLLLLDGLATQPTPAADVAEADAKLREAAALAPKADEVLVKRQPPLRKPPPANLPRVENPIRVSEEKRRCPRCGRDRTCIGYDETEVIDLIPAQVVVRRDRQEKLGCPDCEAEIVRAPPGDKIVPGGQIGTTLVAQVVTDKYRDGLPLHRQKERFARLGWQVAVSTLADQVAWATEALRPVWRQAMRQVLAAVVMNFDSTGLAVLDRAAADGIKLGQLMGAVGDDEVAVYLYASTGKRHGQREGEMGPAEFLAQRTGPTVVDAAPLFDASFERNPGLLECGCNTHARRRFRKALQGGDSRAALPLAAFKKLYAVEEEVRGREPPAVLLARQQKSKPVYDELERWCRVRQPHEPPSSPLGKAISYLLNNIVPLRRFLDDGRVPIDNGAVERLHVRTALTRKNFLFAGSDTGAERAAIVYTVLGSCVLADVDPVAYLTDVLPRLSRRLRLADIPELMPARWKAARAAAAAAPGVSAIPTA
jgi:transposase